MLRRNQIFGVGFTKGDPEYRRFGSMTTPPPPVPDPNFLSEDYHLHSERSMGRVSRQRFLLGSMFY